MGHPPFISNIENGRKEPCLRRLEILANAIDLSLAQLMSTLWPPLKVSSLKWRTGEMTWGIQPLTAARRSGVRSISRHGGAVESDLRFRLVVAERRQSGNR